MIEVGKGAKRPAKSVMMSRYACYLVIQNADPSKEIVAHGQTYFAIQTRRPKFRGASRFKCDAPRKKVRERGFWLSAPGSKCVAPRSKCDTPRSKCGSPRSKCGTPRSECGTPRSECGAPRFKCDTPISKRDTPRSKCGAPRSKCGAPTKKQPATVAGFFKAAGPRVAGPASH